MTNILSLENESGLVSFFLSYNIQRVSAVALSRSITHWVKFHGLAFAVSRLKDMKQQRIHFENGSPSTFVKSKGDLLPIGPFKCLWKSSISFEDSLSMLNVYTCSVSPRITHSQAKKFVDSVNYIGPEISDFLDIDGLTEFSLTSFQKHTQNYGPIMKWIRKDNKRAPTLIDGVIKTAPETSLSIRKVITDFRDASLSNRKLLMKHKLVFHKSIYQCNNSLHLFTKMVADRSLQHMTSDLNFFEEMNKPPLVGKIGQIQEKGLKLRSVANPFRILQHSLYPLGTYLFGMLKQMPTDCTFNQEKGFDFIKEKLNEGETMYAYDLSNATDRFPLSVQIDLIEQLLNKDNSRPGRNNNSPALSHQNDAGVEREDLIKQLALLQDISRGRWISPELEFYSGSPFLQWKTGQPLGLFPSFALFAVTHNALLQNIAVKHDAGDCFRVLGDDVIISNELVARSYKKVLMKYGCKISEDKSIISDKFGEFAGKLTFPTGTLHVPKWQHFTTDNPYGPMACIGVKGLTFVPPQFKKTVTFLMSLPKPHGLELNPKGFSLDERVLDFHEVLMGKQHDLEPVTDFNQSYTDKNESVQDIWKRTILSFNSYVKGFMFDNIEPELPRSLDQKDRYVADVRVIEHFNTYIMNLSNWETPTIDRPQTTVAINRDTWKKPTYNLYKLKSMFRKP